MAFELTTGTLMFLGGIGVIIISVIGSIVTAATAGKRKKKMEERMREKY